ncbi:SDR family NAD(P)-dependent oxidoreductase [Sphingomonas sp. 35-24ZXX]|uniref:SDR family NAD(P)-dependent oxidoreductase n=1 Tax=Sphingomonas sp. 35-24ZXX TaxID=1545915 RepID=UPI00053BF2FA|nr:SDR family NAD(P)-dependent oxidoreductase [Sphingomonas sp. 35-24ZXX]
MTDHPHRRQVLGGAALVGMAALAPQVSAQAAATQALKGKSILITGAATGFGYLGALHYARAGAKVFATMRNLPRPQAAELLKAAEAEKLDISVLELDVLSDSRVAQAVSQAETQAGGALDVIINNAGIGITGPIELQDMEATRLIFDTNVFGAQRVARAALPAMRKAKRGLIIAISSQLGRVIVPNGGHYSATKFALEAMNEQMAYELVAHGIDVTIIEPGGYPTDVWRNRNRYTGELKARIDAERAAGYPAVVSRMGMEDGSGRSADPMDVPRAIADIIALPAGQRPLRRAVHPGPKPQEAINEVAAKVQMQMLGNSPYGPWVKAVHDIG